MRMRVAALVAVTSMLGIAHASESGAPIPVNLIDVEDATCSSLDTLAPEHTETPVVGDYTTALRLRVHVLLVGVDPGVARRIMNHVARVYAPLAINVVPTYEEVDLKITPLPEGATSAVISTSESGAYIQASKDHFGGVRPATADVVYTMLGGELASSVAGQADCVGGIAYADSAFAVGEASWQTDWRIKVSGKIAAHEIAHLLAAHHHFANCAQGNPSDIISDLTPCTLLFNDVGLISLQFSTLEAAVVRRWALDYLSPMSQPAPAPQPSSSPSASPSPASSPSPKPEPSGSPTAQPNPGSEQDPEPQPQSDVQRKVAVELRRASLTGAVRTDADEGRSCVARIAVQIQRRGRDARWSTVSPAATDEAGRFRFRVTRSGVYRVVAPPVDSSDGLTCLRAISEKLRKR